jgi:hypothetical protein
MLSRFFQEGDHLLALYAWEPLEESLDRIARFQMIKQTFHRDVSVNIGTGPIDVILVELKKPAAK